MPTFVWIDTKQDPSMVMQAGEVLSVGFVAAGTPNAWDFTAKAWQPTAANALAPMARSGAPQLNTLWTAWVDTPPIPANGRLALVISHPRFGVIFSDDDPVKPVVGKTLGGSIQIMVN